MEEAKCNELNKMMIKVLQRIVDSNVEDTSKLDKNMISKMLNEEDPEAPAEDATANLPLRRTRTRMYKG